MISALLKKIPLLAVAGLCAVPASLLAIEEIAAPDVSATTRRVRTVAVTGDADIAGWAAKAISAHGAFQVKPTASTKINFTKAGPNAVLVSATGGEKWSFQVTGSSLMDALWRAVDQAIITSGKIYDVQPLFAKTKVAFVRDTSSSASEIYYGDLMLPGAKGLTGHGKRSQSPHWAPDGSAVYYTSWFGSGGADVYRVSVAGGVDRIANYKGTNTGGAVSPDGARIALALSPKGTSDIYVASADGKNLRPVAATADVEMSPCWSPDGTRIAYTGGVSGRPQIMVVPASGGAARRVSTGGYSSEPSWNPVKSNQIAFTVGDHNGIGVADLNTGAVNPVKKAANVSHPTWCADGRHMVVAIGRDGNFKLGLLDSETGKLTVISGASMGSCSDPDALILK